MVSYAFYYLLCLGIHKELGWEEESCRFVDHGGFSLGVLDGSFGAVIVYRVGKLNKEKRVGEQGFQM